MVDDVLEREWQLLSKADPAARAVLAATNADGAYEALYTWSRNELLDDPGDASHRRRLQRMGRTRRPL